MRQNAVLCGNGLIWVQQFQYVVPSYQQIFILIYPDWKQMQTTNKYNLKTEIFFGVPVENIVEKEKILVGNIFFPFPTMFS